MSARVRAYLINEVLAVILRQALCPDDSVSVVSWSSGAEGMGSSQIGLHEFLSFQLDFQTGDISAYLNEVDFGELGVGWGHDDIKNSDNVLVSNHQLHTLARRGTYLKCLKSLISLNVR